MVGRGTLKVVVQTDEGVRRPSSSRWESSYSGSLSQSRRVCGSEGLGELRGRMIEESSIMKRSGVVRVCAGTVEGLGEQRG